MPPVSVRRSSSVQLITFDKPRDHRRGTRRAARLGHRLTLLRYVRFRPEAASQPTTNPGACLSANREASARYRDVSLRDPNRWWCRAGSSSILTHFKPPIIAPPSLFPGHSLPPAPGSPPPPREQRKSKN